MTSVPPYVRKAPGGPIELVSRNGRSVEPMTFGAALKLMAELARALSEERGESKRTPRSLNSVPL